MLYRSTGIQGLFLADEVHLIGRELRFQIIRRGLMVDFPSIKVVKVLTKKRKSREGRGEATQMKNAEDESDISRLKKRRF